MSKKDIAFTYCWTSPCGEHLERTGYVTVWIDPETMTWDYWTHSPYYESERFSLHSLIEYVSKN